MFMARALIARTLGFPFLVFRNGNDRRKKVRFWRRAASRYLRAVFLPLRERGGAREKERDVALYRTRTQVTGHRQAIYLL